MKKILTQYLRPFYARMAVGFLIKFIGTLMDLLLPWTLAHIIDTVVPANHGNEILLWGLFMVGCSVAAVSFNILANRMASRVASDAMYVIRQDLFDRVMYLTGPGMDHFTGPSLISRLTTDGYNVHQMLARIQRLGVRAPILLIGGIVVTLLLDPVLACILLATLPLLAMVIYVVSKKSIPRFLSLQGSVDRFVRLIREDIAGIRVIKALSKGDYERRRFRQANQEVVDWEMQATVTAAATNPIMNILLNLGLVAVILVGAYRVNEGTTEVGKILAFMSYFTIILTALMSISRMFVIWMKAAASADRIVQVLDADGSGMQVIMQETERVSRHSAMPYHIEFDQVSFSHNKVADNLHNICFNLKRGETLGIIGSTGAGKSTIINLLMRFYDVDRGAIRIQGQDIRTMTLKDLRRRFGVAFQNDVIFEGTIMENIDMGRGLTEEQMQQALVYAQADFFVREKGGLDQELEIRGANLSGGQKQRILIARALAAHPEILVLDDSSSALDYQTDAFLRKALKEQFADVTCVIVAQRISSVMYADHILVLEEGKMIGYGTHEELMDTCRIYREIGNSQMGFAEGRPE